MANPARVDMLSFRASPNLFHEVDCRVSSDVRQGKDDLTLSSTSADGPLNGVRLHFEREVSYNNLVKNTGKPSFCSILSSTDAYPYSLAH